jgi:hypothetical protein
MFSLQFYRCPNTGKVIRARTLQRNVACNCGRSNPAALSPKTLNTWLARFVSRFRQTEHTEQTGTHLKRYLEVATDDQVIAALRGHAAWPTHSQRSRDNSDDYRFSKLKSRLEKLATEAWRSQESLHSHFLLEPSALPASSPDRVVEAILNHVRIVCPGLAVPLRVPRFRNWSAYRCRRRIQDSRRLGNY